MHSELPAIFDEIRTITYSELDAESDKAASLLQNAGVIAGDRVGIYLPRSIELCIAILGALKVGAAYVAPDTRYPQSRRDLMLQTSGARIVLTSPSSTERLQSVEAQLIDIEKRAQFDGGFQALAEPQRDSAASVLFTSGSSGTPKAIVLEHQNLVSFATNQGMPQLSTSDQVGQVSSISFDAFHFEFWSSLLAGAQVIILPPVPELLAADFRRQMVKFGITAMLVPTMVVNHVVRADSEAFSSLRILGVGGDVLLPSAAKALLDSRFDGELINFFGPAEITTACTAHRVTKEDADADSVPIGLPLTGVTIRIVDENLRDVAEGEPGELLVAGPGVAKGDQDRPDLTAERFIMIDQEAGQPLRMYRTGDLARRRPDNVLVFMGRADNQVKIRGYRVEHGEIERALCRYEEVHDAVVIADGEGNDRRLVAFVVLEGDISVKELRQRAELHLPDFMVPSQFIVQDHMPATAHGKRDVAALREILAQERKPEASQYEPTTETERYLTELWAELLNVEGIGCDEDFFALGGHSLLAFRMHRRVTRDLACRVSFADLLASSVLRDQAQVIDSMLVSGQS
ncbi:non-ribosomal peptide synthetase [Renibacterium salmoninarum]|nr:non-ribosomal peptide synthetase [Renibacterium salmoninarum]